MIECESCGSENPDDLFFCQSCGTRLLSPESLPEDAKESGIAKLRAVVQQLVSARRAEPEPPAPLLLPPVAGAPVTDAPVTDARLVWLNDDGSDGQAYPLAERVIDIGRTEGDLVFDDPFLASPHARIAEARVLTALEARNGVYRRVRAPEELVSGDRILLGQQLLLFELVPEPERAAPVGEENGVVVFGSRVRPAWGRLLQLTSAGVPRDVYHFGRAEIVVGRERTDVAFTDDALIAPRHAKLSLRGGRVTLEDLASPNGTFLAVREPHRLEPGDVIRMGNQVFRYERADGSAIGEAVHHLLAESSR